MKNLKQTAIVLFGFFLVFCQNEKADKNQHPLEINRNSDYNVLLITIDTLRYDRVSFYTQKFLKTFQIDDLARQSLVFKRAFAHNPVTLPSHVNILTGTTPLYHGISDNGGFRLDEKFLTMAEYLKDKDFGTSAFIGAFPLDSRFGLDQGFDVYNDYYGTHNSLDLFFVERRAADVIEPAVGWISDQSEKWFSWIHIWDPHQPYFPPDPYNESFSADPYSGEVAYVDSQLGVLFDFLKEKNLMSNTLIIFTADHGEALGEKNEKTHSYFAYNNTIHIPLIIYIPGTKPEIFHENVAHIDIFPTICDLLDYEIPDHIQGESIISIVNNKKRKNPEIYFESLTAYLNRGWAPLRGFICQDLKFIDLPIKEVYNIKRDVNENENLAKEYNLKKLNSQLKGIIKRNTGKYRVQRSDKIMGEVKKKLETLGYFSGSGSLKKESFTKAFDLKILLPVQNKMLDALAKYQNGDLKSAVEDLKILAEKNPTFILLFNRLAKIYQEDGRLPEAIDVLRKGLQKNPGNLSLMSKLGIMLVEVNQVKEAIEILNICLKKEKNDPEIFNYLGVAYYKSGNLKIALQNYNKALKLDHNHASVFNNIGSLYLVIFLKDKNIEAYNMALDNFNKALKIDPRLFQAYNGRGAAFKFKGEIKKAIKDWQKAIEIKKDFAEPYINVGITFLEIGDKSSALRYFQTCKNNLYARLPLREQQRLQRLINEAER